MQITRKADYGVRTILDVARLEPGVMALSHEVASRQGIPLNFLAKIVPALARAGLLRSYRGSGGGIALARLPEQITLLDVVEAVDGPIALNLCVVWPEECPRSGVCAVHEVWCDAHASLAARLRGVTIASLLARSLESSSPHPSQTAVQPAPLA